MSETHPPEAKLRDVAQGLLDTAAKGKTTTIYPDAAETFARALLLAADILNEWQRAKE